MKREMSADAHARMLSGLTPGGQKSPYRRKAKRSNAEHARLYGVEMIEHLVEIARHGEPDAARIVAANSVLDRGFGKVLGSDPAQTTPTQITVVTGVNRSQEFGAAREPPRTCSAEDDNRPSHRRSMACR